MRPLNQAYIYMLITLTVVLSLEDNDEGRPYEFGFTIDGQQHRHEKKDQSGIVQGEFGFITADGVYHVTVYATDENGNFKILSMRNIRISAPLDGSPLTGPISPEAGKYLGKQNQLEQSAVTKPSQQSSTYQPIGNSQPPLSVTQRPGSYVFTTQSTIKPACGGCGYVTTQSPVPGQPFAFQNPIFKNPISVKSDTSQFQDQGVGVPKNVQQAVGPAVSPQQFRGQDGSTGQLQINQQQSVDLPLNQQRDQGVPPPNLQTNQYQTANEGVTQNQQNNQPGGQGIIQSPQYQGIGQGFSDSPVNYPKTNTDNNFQNTPVNKQSSPVTDLLPPGIREEYAERQYGIQPRLFDSENEQRQPNIPNRGTPTEPKQSGDDFISNNVPEIGTNPLSHRQGKSSRLPPISVSDNKIHVGGSKPIDIPIKDKYPGMTDGLPEGIDEKDIKDILYKFHYTVGFHGHYEKGLKNGAKIGGYFVNGRDGISRVVTYIADENGYRPKFKFINLGLDSPETPKEGSEKQFGLKSFEFVWYPIE